jgi:2-deoxy-D-gluconate 3-dehydrogenase
MPPLDDKMALITGGGRGLGRAIAIAFADAGADVAVASRTREHVESVAQEIRAKGRRGIALQVDIRDSKSVAKMVDAVRKELGRIDVLVNSAGEGWSSRVTETSDEDWERIIATNLNGTFYACREVARVMIEQKNGCIINMASISGLRGVVGFGAYGASKGGVIQLTRTLALELARHNIRVNALAPGYFRTDMNSAALDDPNIGPKIVERIPLRRVGNVNEIGPLAVYLASDEAAFVTGEVFTISGGQMAS